MAAANVCSDTITETFTCLDYLREFYDDVDDKFTQMKVHYSSFVKDVINERESIKVVFYQVPGWEAIKSIFQQKCITSKIVDMPVPIE